MASVSVLSGGLEVPAKLKTGSSAVTSATTAQLGDTNQHIVSGTTTINALTVDDWTIGSEITLIFSGILTLKHNTAGAAGSAKVLLASSTDLTTAANTVLKLAYDGTFWQEVSRKVA